MPDADYDGIVFPEDMGELCEMYVRDDGARYAGLPVPVVRALLDLARAGIALRMALDDREGPIEARAVVLAEASLRHMDMTMELHAAVLAAGASS